MIQKRETTAEQNWSSRVLERQINTHTFERLLSTQSESPDSASPREQVLTQLKAPYVLEFLGLSEDPSLLEKELESAIIELLGVHAPQDSNAK